METNKNEMVAVTGNTYPVKDKLKALGARWNGAQRCWMIQASRLAEAQAIVAGQKLPTPATEAAPAAEVAWSDEQRAIFGWFGNGSGNMVVQARAGTGKTTTIKQAFSYAPEQGRLLYAVFNKKNQKEAAEKITDARVEIRTLHSLGYYFIKNVWKDAKPDDNVEWDRVKRLAGDVADEVISATVKLVSFCKNLTVGVPELREVIEIADARNISVSDELAAEFSPTVLAKLAIEVLQESLEKDFASRVSFDDMVWLPVAAGWVKPTFELVVVDEAQDMNMPQLMMAERAAKGRICIVGDSRQAIYGFRGAASDGMKMMKQRLNADELGLTTTYRCPRTVVALAQEMVPDYTAAPTAPEGEVLEMSVPHAIRSLQVGDAVLSRLNAPLMSICLGLLRDGIPARIEGRDIGKQLVGMVRKLKAKSVPDFLKKLAAWGERQSKRIIALGGKHAAGKVEMIADQVTTLATVAEGAESVADIESRIIDLFEDTDSARKPAVVCSSVHKAKGLEWNKVCLIAETFKNRHQSQEEANIYYVAVTRAKKTLVVAV